jgi:hypothetical protein
MRKYEAVITSFRANESAEIFGKLRIVTFRFALYSVVPAFAAVLFLQDAVPVLLPAIFFGIIAGTAAATQTLVSGRYDWEKLEKMLTQARSAALERALDLTAKLGWRHGKDDRSVYDTLGAEIIGFRLKPAEANFDEIFRGAFDSIAKSLPIGASLYVLRHNRRVTKGMRPELIERGVCASECFLFFRLPLHLFGNATARKKLIDFMSRVGDRLSAADMAGCIEQIYEPGRPDSGSTLPSPRSAARLEAEVADVGLPGQVAAAISLCRLPQVLDERFAGLWDAFQRLPGSVCVRFEAVPGDGLMKGALKTVWRTKLGIGKATSEEVDRDAVQLAMYAGGLIHGTREAVTEALEYFEGEVMRLTDRFEPVFGRDTAFLKEALLALTPGSDRRVPFRRILITNAKEALGYIPRALPTVSEDSPDLDLRLASGTRLCVKNSFAAPTFIAGGMEGGKSTLLAYIMLSHLERGRRGESIASFVCEVGDTFVFLREGVADVVYSLELRDGGVFGPMQDHPLRMFFAWDDAGLEAAHRWICDLMHISPEEQARESRVVHRALVRAKSEDAYRLGGFLEILQAELSLIDETVADKPNHPFRKYCAKLAMFSSGDRFGPIFDPDESRNYDYRNARHFYFVKAQGTKGYPELDRAFFSLANAVSAVLETRFEPKSKHAAKCLVIYDEIDHQKEYVTQRQLSDNNRQGRKQAKMSYYASQALSDGVIDDEAPEKKFSFLETCKRFFFIDMGSNIELWARALKLKGTDDPVIRQMEEVARANQEARASGAYSWGYIDEHKRVYQFYLDVSKFDLWCCTTHPGGVALRREALSTGLDFFEVCAKLAEKIWPIPRSENISPEFLKAQMWNVFDIKPLPETETSHDRHGRRASGTRKNLIGSVAARDDALSSND